MSTKECAAHEFNLGASLDLIGDPPQEAELAIPAKKILDKFQTKCDNTLPSPQRSING